MQNKVKKFVVGVCASDTAGIKMMLFEGSEYALKKFMVECVSGGVDEEHQGTHKPNDVEFHEYSKTFDAYSVFEDYHIECSAVALDDLYCVPGSFDPTSH